MNKFVEQFEKYELPMHGVRLPRINISIEEKRKIGAPEDCTNYEYLTHLCYKGFENKLLSGKIPKEKTDEYTARCKEELKVFKDNNLVDYFLLIYDILKWCDENEIARGVARGSSAGSLVLYLLSITTCVDPIKHNLFFTRFLNEARLQSKEIDGEIYLTGSIADVDCDVSYENRNKVINYVNKKFENKTSKISTSIRLSTRILIKEVSKVYLNYTEDEALRLSSQVESLFGKVDSLEKTYKESKDLKEWVDSSAENKKAFLIAEQLEGLIKARGQHPAGIAIAYDDINNVLPLEIVSGNIVSSYDMNDIANILIKLDLLGLKNADVNYKVCNMLGITQEDIDINDPSIYHYLQNTDCYHGLFQIESGLTKKTVVDVKPRNIQELAACISISRPGTYKDIGKYLKYVHEGKLESIHPKIDEITKEAGGIILYQEFINAICQNVYGMSAKDADSVRYCIGKKKRDEIKKWEPVIYEQGEKNNIPKEVTDKVWRVIQDSADYQFCKSHGFSYATMCATNTYLKANHPKEFYLSLLQISKNEPDYTQLFSEIKAELDKQDIKLYSPNIIYSDEDFKLYKDGIIFGISAIKGVSDKTLSKLTDFRHEYSNKFEIFHAAKECSLSISVLVSLIGAGCLSDHIDNRAKVMLEAQIWNLLKEKEHQKSLEYGPKFDFDLIETLKFLNKELKDDKGKPIIKDSRYATIKKHATPYIDAYKENKKNENLLKYWLEWKNLGFSYSTNLFNIYKKECPDLIPVQGVIDEPEDSLVQLVGHVTEAKQGKSKAKKTPYLKLTLKDGGFQITCLAFNTEKFQAIDEIKYQNERLPKEEDIVIVNGRRKGDAVFVKNLSIQEIKVFDKPIKTK